jgi:hydroxylamine reductase (hybrid-cluster protein)
MKRLLILLVASVLSSAASAQKRATTKQECNRRCVTSEDPYPKRIDHEEKLKKIRDKKKAETDRAKLNQLANDEEAEIDRFKDEHEKVCRFICEHNPDE